MFARQTQLSTIPTEPIWRLSVGQYHQMIASGILTADDRVELLDGLLTLKMPKKPPHRLVTKLLRTCLEALTTEGWYTDSQEPITLATSEPEPDLMIVQGNPRDYSDRHPSGTDLGLVVEIADTTLERVGDSRAVLPRTLKKQLYAEAQIPCYWLINLPERSLTIYTNPITQEGRSDYQQSATIDETGVVPVVIAGQKWGAIALSDVLPEHKN
ncbi:Uma2 family endonuclease [Spirulina major CS-329]|uniref:Uma2 family endonuclease n=1 Tax=Spirulina TaxID=1154 RepID=UPI00232F7F77|nr:MULTISPECIES: Uma2 family endonuclease [Spirulina]MDB9495688.1 Uma2 family endonuclease [Spirulina subsalsa CS-330]MDB9505347.1 Uma2 family endonuclease [Spirulina major CS-329]